MKKLLINTGLLVALTLSASCEVIKDLAGTDESGDNSPQLDVKGDGNTISFPSSFPAPETTPTPTPDANATTTPNPNQAGFGLLPSLVIVFIAMGTGCVSRGPLNLSLNFSGYNRGGEVAGVKSASGGGLTGAKVAGAEIETEGGGNAQAQADVDVNSDADTNSAPPEG